MCATFFSRLGALLVVAAMAIQAEAGTFFSEFNSGMPKGTAVFGDAFVDNKGGDKDTGVLKLTVPLISQMGSFIVQPLDGKSRVVSFVATFKAYIGGGNSADGFAFHFSPALLDAPFSDSSMSGLMVVFDTFKNGSQLAPGIRLQSHGGKKFEAFVPDLRAEKFVDVMVKVDPDGTADVVYNNELIFTNVPTTSTNMLGRFGFGARTGSRTDNHFIDDLKIITQTTPRPFVQTFLPVGNDVSPSVMVEVRIQNAKAKVKAGSVRMKFDGEPVTPEVTREKSVITALRFEPEKLFEPGSSHMVTVQYEGDGKPAVTNEFSYSFKITSQVMISR